MQGVPLEETRRRVAELVAELRQREPGHQSFSRSKVHVRKGTSAPDFAVERDEGDKRSRVCG